MLAIIGAWHISRLLLVLYLLAYHLGGLYNVEMLWFRRPLIDIYVVSMVLSLNMLILHYSRHPMSNPEWHLRPGDVYCGKRS